MSEFDVSMRLHRPEEERVKAERKPLDWSKFTTAIQICGAILTIPVGVAGVYAAYRSNFSAEVTCQALRATIISTLEKNVDMDTKRALARRDVAEFERTCAAIDPDAKRVFASMMAPKAEPAALPGPGAPTAPELAKPVIKANAAAHDLINEAIEREAARVPAQVKAPATVATPLTTPTVKPSAAPVNTAKSADRPKAGDKPAIVERAAVAPKGDKPALGEPPAPLGHLAVPAEATANSSAGPKPVPAVTPAVVPRTAALPATEPVVAPDTTSVPMGGPIPPAAPPPLETAHVPAASPTFSQPATSPPPVAARPEPIRESASEPARKSGLNIPFVSDLFGAAPPRPPGEIARDALPENGPAN